MAAHAAQPACRGHRAGLQPGVRSRCLPRTGRFPHEALEVPAGFFRLAQAAVAFREPEEQFASRVIAELVEVRRLQRQHMLVVSNGLLEERASETPCSFSFSEVVCDTMKRPSLQRAD